MFAMPHSTLVLKAVSLVVLLLCCLGIALVGLHRPSSPIGRECPLLNAALRVLRFLLLVGCLPRFSPVFQASQDCANLEYNLQLVQFSGFEESLLVHIRRTRNTSTISSGDVVDFTICSVTLFGSSGRSNGRFASYYIGACSNHSPRISSSLAS
jgi:hypothetical protein